VPRSVPNEGQLSAWCVRSIRYALCIFSEVLRLLQDVNILPIQETEGVYTETEGHNSPPLAGIGGVRDVRNVPAVYRASDGATRVVLVY
jgi:hypothetical protein